MISLGFADVTFLFIGFFLYATGLPVVEQQQGAVMGRQQYRMEAEARVEEINKSGGSWKAKLHPRLAELSDEEIRRQFLGLAMDSEEHIKRREKMLADDHENLVKNEEKSKQMPLSFDARDEWPECADLINKIQDQSGCGSCWAVSSASVMQDRICIRSNGTQKVEISAKDLLTCDPKSHGCNGGFPNKAFEFWHANGVVSGSNYNLKKGCKPYPFPPHSREQYDTPPCMRHCDSWKNWYQYKSDKHYGLKPTSLKFAKQEKIMDAIRQGGPVVAGMIVYKDFIDYDSGVYEHGRKAKILGGHAVRIVGWGVDEASGKPYWLVANSWNTDWGMDGYFKIARGKDESYIESWLIAFADPKL